MKCNSIQYKDLQAGLLAASDPDAGAELCRSVSSQSATHMLAQLSSSVLSCQKISKSCPVCIQLHGAVRGQATTTCLKQACWQLLEQVLLQLVGMLAVPQHQAWWTAV